MTKHIPMTPPESAEINERLDELKASGANKIRVIFKLYQNFEWQLGINEDGAMHPRVHHILLGDETLQDFDGEYTLDEAQYGKAYKQESGLYHIYFDSIEAFQHAVKSADQ